LLSCFGEGEFFENGKGVFLSGFCPQYFGQCGGATAQIAGNEPLGKMDSVLPKLFSGE